MYELIVLREKIRTSQMVKGGFPVNNQEDELQKEQENNQESETIPSEKETDQIKEMGSITAKGKHVIHCLTIIGQIEGHYVLAAQNKATKYEHVIPQLFAVEQSPEIEGLLILLNT